MVVEYVSFKGEDLVHKKKKSKRERSSLENILYLISVFNKYWDCFWVSKFWFWYFFYFKKKLGIWNSCKTRWALSEGQKWIFAIKYVWCNCIDLLTKKTLNNCLLLGPNSEVPEKNQISFCVMRFFFVLERDGVKAFRNFLTKSKNWCNIVLNAVLLQKLISFNLQQQKKNYQRKLNYSNFLWITLFLERQCFFLFLCFKKYCLQT